MTYRNETGLPSVTELIRPYVDTRWYTEESRKRGSVVHAACAAVARGLFCPPMASDLQGYVDSFGRWFADNVRAVHETEKRYVHEALGYTGQLDLVATLSGVDGPAVIDLKTAAVAYRSWAVQLAAYRELYGYAEGVAPPPLPRTGYLMLARDGSEPKLHLYKSATMGRAMNVFLGLLNAHNYFKKGGRL